MAKSPPNMRLKHPYYKQVTIEGVTYKVPEIRYVFEAYGLFGWYYPNPDKPAKGSWNECVLTGKMSLYYFPATGMTNNVPGSPEEYYYDFPGKSDNLTKIENYDQLLEIVASSPRAIELAKTNFPKGKFRGVGEVLDKMKQVVEAYNGD